MPTPTLVIGAPCWIDLYSSDTEKATEFYGGLFGWTTEMQREEFGGYFTFLKDGKHVGGCMANSGEEGQPGLVDGLPRRPTTSSAPPPTRRRRAARCTWSRCRWRRTAPSRSSATPAAPASAHGRPTRSRASRSGTSPARRGGSSSTRGTTTQASTSTATCSGGTRNTFSDEPDFRYTTLRAGADDLAGIQDATQYLPEGAPAFWTIYFGVDDTDAALERIVELGGKVTQPAEDTPYGRLAQAADPTGTSFKLMASSS